MSTVIDEKQLKSLCQAGNIINAGIESSDFAEVRKALDACITMLRAMADNGHFDSYITAKLALAFTAGLAITEQGGMLTSLFQLGKLFSDDQLVFEARCKIAASYDGMQCNSQLTPRDLRLLATGMYFCCHQENIQLQIRDTMVMLEIKIIEKILFKKEKQGSQSYTETEQKRLLEYFLQYPDMIFEYLRHDDRQLVCELISFWEYSLQLAYGNDIPEQCARSFSEKLRENPIYERHNHIRLLPMLAWECKKAVEEDEFEEELPVTVGIAQTLTSPVVLGWFSEMPAIGRPIKATLVLHFLTGLLAVGLPEVLLWSGIAVTLASVFYRTCLHFKEEMNEKIVPAATFIVYLFAGFMSIGAFGAEGIVVGMFVALVMHIILPLFFGLALVGRRKILNVLKDVFGSSNYRRLK